jgi:hypothetical protein
VDQSGFIPVTVITACIEARSDAELPVGQAGAKEGAKRRKLGEETKQSLPHRHKHRERERTLFVYKNTDLRKKGVSIWEKQNYIQILRRAATPRFSLLVGWEEEVRCIYKKRRKT